MIDLVPAQPWMLNSIALQPIQEAFRSEMTHDDVARAAQSGVALACVRGPTIIAMGGITQIWEGRGLVWGLLSPSIHATMVPIHRIVSRGLDNCIFKRVEAQVAVEHEEGHRWMSLLGFEREGVMRKFWKGRDYALYARVRD